MRARVAVRSPGPASRWCNGSRAAGGSPRPDSDLDVAGWWPSTAPTPTSPDRPWPGPRPPNLPAMADFTVDVGGLGAVRADLARGGEHLDAALGGLDRVGAGSLGTAALDQACARFLDDRRQGLRKVRDCARELDRGLDETQRAYAETERAVAGGFGGRP